MTIGNTIRRVRAAFLRWQLRQCKQALVILRREHMNDTTARRLFPQYRAQLDRQMLATRVAMVMERNRQAHLRAQLNAL